MYQFVDSILVFSDLEKAVAGLAAIDTDHTLLEWDEETGTPLPIFHARNRVFNWAGGKPPMCAMRLTVDVYMKIKAANIVGFKIIGAGYAEDDIESLFINNTTNFTKWEIDDNNEMVQVNIDLDGDEVRVAPTPGTLLDYRVYWPKYVTYDDENGTPTVHENGRFFWFGGS